MLGGVLSVAAGVLSDSDIVTRGYRAARKTSSRSGSRGSVFIHVVVGRAAALSRNPGVSVLTRRDPACLGVVPRTAYTPPLMSPRLLLTFVSIATLAIACGSGDGDSGSGDGQRQARRPARSLEQAARLGRPGRRREARREALGGHQQQGRDYLPNVFYADASENEQIMPWAIDGHVQIDRLVYPTLGNPNPLHEERSQRSVHDRPPHRGRRLRAPRPQARAHRRLDALAPPRRQRRRQRLHVLLIPRGARENNTESKLPISSGNGTGVFRIYPNEVLVNPIRTTCRTA